jgi:hypothetical protein
VNEGAETIPFSYRISICDFMKQIIDAEYRRLNEGPETIPFSYRINLSCFINRPFTQNITR